MTTTPITERPLKAKVARRSARQRVQALMYLDLGSENGGFPVNISEDGMSFQGIRPLQVDQEIFITFRLDGTDESITTKAKIVWLTETRKAGALQFVDMPEDSRRQITEWIALQNQNEDESPEQDVALAPSKAKVEDSPAASAPVSVVATPSLVPGHAFVIEPTPSPAQVVPAAPQPLGTSLPAFSMEGPNPPRVASEPASLPTVISKAQPEGKPSLPVQLSSGLAKPQQTGRFTVPPAKPAHRTRSGRSRSLEIGLAAFGAMAIVAGVLLWPSHEALLQRIHWNPNVTRNAADAAAIAPMTSPPVSDAPTAEMPSDLPMKDPSQISLAPNLEPALPASSSPAAPTKAQTDRPEKSAAATRAANPNPGTAESAPFFSLRAMRPRNAALTAARNRQSNSAPPDSVLENTSELPGVGASSGQMLLLQSRAPASPVTTSGSVEIISDPYPSIRMPAGSQPRTSSLGESLQIGRLASKVEPIYPPEALRQRIGGKVRLHVVIDRMGAVESVSIVDGPALLAESALRAVRQWRYEATTVGGEAVEIEQDVTLAFRVTNSSPAN